MKKNTGGQKYRVFAFDLATGAQKTGDAANITAKLSIDYGARTAIADTNPTEAEGGFYDFDLSQAETNGYRLDFFPASATSGVQVIGVPATVFTVPYSSINPVPKADAEVRRII